MKNKIKNIFKILAVTAGCLMFASFSPSLDGRAVVVDKGVFPQGLFAKTVGYLPGDIISVTNIAGDATVDILVIGADTVVAYEGKILGKPVDEADAKGTLSMLSGHTHSVFTGVTLVFIDKSGRTGEHDFYEKTDVEFYPMTEEEIDRYVLSGEPMDKAGSYGIQGAFAVLILLPFYRIA